MDHPLYKLITEQLDDIFSYTKRDQQTVIDRCARSVVAFVGQIPQPEGDTKPIEIKTYTAKDFADGTFPNPYEVYIFSYEYVTDTPFEVNVSGDRKCGYFKDEECARIFAEALTNRKREDTGL